ncbi:ATP-binding protein [Candidatus Pacearchaeota archaeon]|nr:MAG: ATP-binding protein [Candidatus Pacearchaeota archaeon]RLJ02168.1 MAG: ATP-binding protein [Candidatus Aenigmarchaeota archaeon]
MEWISLQNPWWSDENWEEKDKHLRDWKNQKVKWIPKWVKQISLEPFSLNFIYGIRQLGKTTGIKLLIREILKKKNPFAVFFFDFELVSSVKEFRKIIENYLEIKKREKVDTSFLFLDEVSSVKEWWKIIKFLVDRGVFENDVVTVLGSSTLNIIKAPERFPGRKGKGKEIEVLPLSFPEFVEINGYNLRKVLYREDLIKELWEKYKKTGGFPKSINQHKDANESFISAMLSEARKHDKSTEIFEGIIEVILRKIPSALSYHSIAKDIEISHKTVREYIEFFEDSLIAKRIYWKNKYSIKRKEKKIFFRDPFIYHSFSFWTGTKFLESALFEGIVQEHLLRKFGEIYYFKNSYEIDCIARDLKIEVKAGKPHRKYPKGVRILEEEEIPKFLIEISK